MSLSYNGTRIFSGPVYQPEGSSSAANRRLIENYINSPYASAEGKNIFETFAQHFKRSEALGMAGRKRRIVSGAGSLMYGTQL